MPELLRVTGIRAVGRHGASDGEQDRAQDLVVDVEAVVEAEKDDLGTTADYRRIVAVVRELVERESHALVETIAERVAETVAGITGVLTCRAQVHKPAAAERLGVSDVSAEATAGRPGR